MTKSLLKTLLFGSLIAAGGCAVGPYDGYYTIEADIPIIEVPSPRIPPSCESCNSSMTIELDWDSFVNDVNLDLELTTPSHSLVSVTTGTVDGCYQLGDDFGVYGSGVEQVICRNPLSGSYEARVVNASDVFVHATLIFHTPTQDFTRSIDVDAWGMSVVPITLR